MATGRNNKLVGQVGEFLVCAEIGRRLGLIATPFSGNVPLFDVVAVNDSGKSIPIQVKASNGHTFPFDVEKWVEIEFDPKSQTQRHGSLRPLDMPELIHVLVMLSGKSELRRDRFFVCTRKELQIEIAAENKEFLQKHQGKRPKNWRSTRSGLSTKRLAQFENRWSLIQEQFGAGDRRSLRQS